MEKDPHGAHMWRLRNNREGIRIVVLIIVGLIAMLTPSTAQNLVVSEVMFHPKDDNELEFIELLNVGTSEVQLSGHRFSTGIEYVFPDASLKPGERVVVAKNRSLLLQNDSILEDRLMPGEYGGSLRNEGELVELYHPSGLLVFSFMYDNKGDWPERARGLGSSMELKNANEDPNDPRAWRASVEYGGSPGWAGIGKTSGVVINEILPHTDLPLEDAIELFNPTDQNISIAGWYLTDDLAVPEKYRIPAGSTISPSGYWTVFELRFNLLNPDVPFSLNSYEGDALWLISSDTRGRPALFMDEVKFEATENGVSLGRYPNGSGPLVPQKALSFGTQVKSGDPEEWILLFRQGRGALNAGPLVGPVVVSEIMYEPEGSDMEYVRLSNPGNRPVALFDIEHPVNTWSFGAGIEFQFPESVILSPGEDLFVVGGDPALFRILQGVSAETQVLGPFTGRLDNAGEELVLYKPDAPQTRPPNVGFVPRIPVERIQYDNKAPWPVPSKPGISIKRRVLSAFGNDPGNWSVLWVDPTDVDNDGMDDSWEIENGLDPSDPADAHGDFDGDGLSHIGEYVAGTDPRDGTSYLKWDTFAMKGLVLNLGFSMKTGRLYILSRRMNDESTWLESQRIQAESSGDGVFEVDLSGLAKGNFIFRLEVMKP